MAKPTLHVIANAHLDPVWLWDSREGRNEAVALFRAMAGLLEANPDLVFTRGEAAVYEHVRRVDPDVFARVRRLVRAGRWDVVGGTWIQPDANLTDPETLCRQYDSGLRWFRERLGVRVSAGWEPDCFGHSAGVPEILAAGGLRDYAFFRPEPGSGSPVPGPAFWWRGRAGARILAYRAPAGGYNSGRADVPSRLDAVAAAARAARPALRNVAAFIGLGDHGGGPSQRMVNEVREWARAHPEVAVRFSGLTGFFAALRRELAGPRTPALEEVRGELNFCLRGCYASVGRLKHAFRRAEHELLRAERTAALLHRAGIAPVPELAAAWRAVLFNSFHDILPGTSIERALGEQEEELAGARHEARETVFRSLNRLATRVRIELPAVGPDHPKAVPFVVWNPRPEPVRTFVELEACLDSQLIAPYRGREAELPVEVRVGGRRTPFQILPQEHEQLGDHAWRKRALVPVDLPSLGWAVASLGWVEGAAMPAGPKAVETAPGTIRNAFYAVSARPGAAGIRIAHRGRDLFGPRGLRLETVADTWGSWGSMREEPASYLLTRRVDAWKVERVALVETGPLRAALAVRLVARRARVELVFRVTTGVDELAIDARIFGDLTAARIMLVFPGVRSAECEVPAETAVRAGPGEVPVLRWLRARGDRGFAFAADVLSAYNLDGRGNLRVTLLRATRYACVGANDPGREWWRPCVDRGELRARMILQPRNGPIERAAALLSEPPVATMAWENPHGDLPTVASLAALAPADILLLALKSGPEGRGLDLRVQNRAAVARTARFRWAGRSQVLGRLLPGEIATFRFAGNPTRPPRRIELGV